MFECIPLWTLKYIYIVYIEHVSLQKKCVKAKIPKWKMTGENIIVY